MAYSRCICFYTWFFVVVNIFSSSFLHRRSKFGCSYWWPFLQWIFPLLLSMIVTYFSKAYIGNPIILHGAKAEMLYWFYCWLAIWILLRFSVEDYKAPNFVYNLMKMILVVSLVCLLICFLFCTSIIILVYTIFSSGFLYDTLQDENLLATFKKQLEEDKKIVTSRSNLNALRKVILWFLNHYFTLLMIYRWWYIQMLSNWDSNRELPS